MKKKRIEYRDKQTKRGEKKYSLICVTDPVSIKSVESGADEDFDAGHY